MHIDKTFWIEVFSNGRIAPINRDCVGKVSIDDFFGSIAITLRIFKAQVKFILTQKIGFIDNGVAYSVEYPPPPATER